jgi:hypothetical protein
MNSRHNHYSKVGLRHRTRYNTTSALTWTLPRLPQHIDGLQLELHSVVAQYRIAGLIGSVPGSISHLRVLTQQWRLRNVTSLVCVFFNMLLMDVEDTM